MSASLLRKGIPHTVDGIAVEKTASIHLRSQGELLKRKVSIWAGLSETKYKKVKSQCFKYINGMFQFSSMEHMTKDI